MPSGVYKRLLPNSGEFKKGSEPHNKGKQLDHVKKKVERFKQGLPIECKRHGIHSEWRLHSHNNVQCKKCANENAKRHRDKNYLRYLASYTKRRDKNTEVTEDFLKELILEQNGRCALTGIYFDDDHKPSVDRIDSGVGYVKSNIQLVLYSVNRMKSDLSQSDFMELCRNVTNWNSIR